MRHDRKIIALDIGGVCVSLQFEKCFEALDIEHGSAQMSAFLDICRTLGNGEIGEDLWLEKSFSIFNGRFSKNHIREAWEMVLGPAIPGMTEFIQSLAMHGYEFAFLSDTSTVHMARFKSSYGLWELAAGGVFSYEVGHHKPDQTMYEAFEERFGIPALYLDDMQPNINAASSRGWDCKLFNDISKVKDLLNMRDQMKHETIVDKAQNFLENEREFHLGFLPTEQPNPKTITLDKTFAESSANGVRMLQSVDRDMIPMAERVLKSFEFARMKTAISNAVESGHKVVFSGCGATGRLSILLESMWRHFFITLKKHDSALYKKIGQYENSVFSIMTGGDFALIRSVESFEDYQEFGRKQAQEMRIEKGDVLIAITEGGETSSVLGTVFESVEKGASAFLLFNNPADLLSKHLKRSRDAITNPQVTVLDLYCGPMALSGSTRMQATSSEQLIAGAALESALCEILEKNGDNTFSQTDYLATFKELLTELEKDESVSGISNYIKFEEKIYREKGLVTYYAGDYMLDIFTDTTERSPTFMLPPFRKCDDRNSPVSLAFVKNPLYKTSAAWETVLGRKPRCLEWKKPDYLEMNAEKKILDNPPAVSYEDINKFIIGNEDDSARFSEGNDAAVMVIMSSETENENFSEFENAFKNLPMQYKNKKILAIGSCNSSHDFNIPLKLKNSPLKLIEHMAVKLVLNTISTGTMVRLGKVTGNWMSFVEVTNKKLIDRGIRIISSLCEIDYEKACYELFASIEFLSKNPPIDGKKISPVQYTITKLRDDNK